MDADDDPAAEEERAEKEEAHEASKMVFFFYMFLVYTAYELSIQHALPWRHVTVHRHVCVRGSERHPRQSEAGESQGT